jgi:hypothetical protein
MRRLAACGADVLLAGHLHVSFTGRTAERYQISGHSALVVQAGTAISTRGRGEFNSFNILRIERQRIAVERYSWKPGAAGGEFIAGLVDRFEHTPEGWLPLGG